VSVPSPGALDASGDNLIGVRMDDISQRGTADEKAESRLKRTANACRSRYEGSAAQEFFRRLRALDFGDQIILFGAALLLSVLPIVILLSAFATTRIDDDIARNMSLNQKGSQDISRLFTAAHVSFNISILIALLTSLAGTIALGISIQGIYEKVFGHEHVRGALNVLRCFSWVACVGALLIADAAISKPLDHVPAGSVLQGLVHFVSLTVFFWWTMHFLLAGRESWRRLRPAAIATALFWIGFGVFSSFYFSGSIVSDDQLYGPIGIVFDIVTWFIAVGAVITLGAVAGVVWETRRRRSPT
jgi:membrane protein